MLLCVGLGSDFLVFGLRLTPVQCRRQSQSPTAELVEPGKRLLCRLSPRRRRPVAGRQG